jgi:hypothetical protein
MNEEVAKILDELAARFGAPGAELWAELVRYQVWTATLNAVVLIMFASTFAGAAWKAFRWARADHDYDSELKYFVACILALVAMFLCGIAADVSVDAVATLLSPQAATIRALFR